MAFKMYQKNIYFLFKKRVDKIYLEMVYYTYREKNNIFREWCEDDDFQPTTYTTCIFFCASIICQMKKSSDRVIIYIQVWKR